MDKLRKAIEVLKKGGIVIFPTDTAFGIGCRLDNEPSVKRLFAIRRRPIFQPTPVLVDSTKMLKNYWVSPIAGKVKDLLCRYWPGALTIIYKCQVDKVLPLVRGGGETLGVRMPDHKIALSLIKGVGVPILGPSANFHGEKTPYTYDELDGRLIKLVDYVVEGECNLGQVSTVVDCSKEPFKIVRGGAVNPKL